MSSLKNNSKTGIFSFFAGAGFLDLGFEDTGSFDILFVNEFHAPFMDIYRNSRRAMRMREPEYGYHNIDISVFLNGSKAKHLTNCISSAKENYDVVGFIGGPPCPDFSVGGKNKGVEGENGKLSDIYIELILKNFPDFFLFENVKGLYRTKKHQDFFDSIKKKLVEKGYCITERLINAIEYGVPQNRERIILVGFKRELLEYLGAKNNGSTEMVGFDWQKRILFSAPNVFSKPWPREEYFVEDSVKECPAGICQALTVEYWFRKNDVENHPNSMHCFKPKAGLAKFKTIDEGDDLKKSYKRLHRWRYSPTAAYGNNEVHLHPYKARRITVAEALAIQSLPKNFIIPANTTLTNMFKAVGNGVPYLAAKGLAETIEYYITSLKNGENSNAKAVSK